MQLCSIEMVENVDVFLHRDGVEFHPTGSLFLPNYFVRYLKIIVGTCNELCSLKKLIPNDVVSEIQINDGLAAELKC